MFSCGFCSLSRWTLDVPWPFPECIIVHCMVTGVIGLLCEPRNASEQLLTASKPPILGPSMSACLLRLPEAPGWFLVVRTDFERWGMVQTKHPEQKKSLQMSILGSPERIFSDEKKRVFQRRCGWVRPGVADFINSDIMPRVRQLFDICGETCVWCAGHVSPGYYYGSDVMRGAKYMTRIFLICLYGQISMIVQICQFNSSTIRPR